MGKYTIQSRLWKYDKWDTYDYLHFDTPQEAKQWLDDHGHKIGDYYRVVEAYTVTRYKAVKV